MDLDQFERCHICGHNSKTVEIDGKETEIPLNVEKRFGEPICVNCLKIDIQERKEYYKKKKRKKK